MSMYYTSTTQQKIRLTHTHHSKKSLQVLVKHNTMPPLPSPRSNDLTTLRHPVLQILQRQTSVLRRGLLTLQGVFRPDTLGIHKFRFPGLYLVGVGGWVAGWWWLDRWTLSFKAWMLGRVGTSNSLWFLIWMDWIDSDLKKMTFF